MIGSKILNYTIIDKIGEGGMGIVYLGVHNTLDRKVAIKILNPSFASDIEIKGRFINEAKALSGLLHPNIVTLFDFTEFESSFCIIMEYIQGTALDVIIRKVQGYIPEHRSIKIMDKILSAFSYAHSKGIIHRDIKPSNIIIQDNDEPKILDFGIAKILKGDMNFTKVGTAAGSVQYMSPEQILGNPTDIRTDIYSLGITFYEMLTAKQPFTSVSTSEYIIQDKITKDPVPSVKKTNPEISDRIDKIIAKATSKNPDDRYADCNDFRNELLNINQYSSDSTQTSVAGSINDSTKTVINTVSPSTLPSPPPPPPPPSYQQTSQTQYDSSQGNIKQDSYKASEIPTYSTAGSYYQNSNSIKSSKKGWIAGIIVAGFLIISLIAGVGLLIYFLSDKSNEEKKPNIERTDRQTDKNSEKRDKVIENNSSEVEILYFCEEYDPVEGEIGNSDRFSTGWLTVMLDLRKSGKKIGVKDVEIRISKIKDASGKKISEKIMKTIKFTVEPDFEYIYFTDKKNLKFDTPGTYKVTLMDKKGNLIAKGEVDIVP